MITEFDLQFSMYHGEVDKIFFDVWDDGDIELIDPPAYIQYITLQKILDISREFISKRRLI